MTVRLSDWDGQNSSLAFLIWLMMTIMVTMMMMPVSLRNTVPDCVRPLDNHYRHHYLFRMTTQKCRDVPRARKEARGGVSDDEHSKLDKRRPEDKSGGREDQRS